MLTQQYNCAGVPISCLLTAYWGGQCPISIGAFNQEKSLTGTLSVIVKTDGSFASLTNTQHTGERMAN